MNAVELARDLIRFRTINPPGDEAPCARFLGAILENAGFSTDFVSIGENRENLIARIGGSTSALPICFSGHTDVVPLGAADWSVDPFAAELKDGKLFGRGSTDMKGGVAAFVATAVRLAPKLASTAGVVLVITADEELGCGGANFIAAQGVLPKAGAMVIAEPTSNQVLAGHKGVAWLEAVATGVTAHGSMPHKGVNAVYKAARAVLALEAFDFSRYSHPVLGQCTLNVGTLRGGLNVNSVPDEAKIGIDIRLVPGVDREALIRDLDKATNGEITFALRSTHSPVWTDPSDPFIQETAAITQGVTGHDTAISGAAYFTDAAALKPAMGNPPTVILGPGEPDLAHQTDEYCFVDKIEQADAIFTEIVKRWCKL